VKYRKGFVANSSSSSFTCNVCGEIYDDYDSTYKDLCVVECTSNHIICDGHLLEPTKKTLKAMTRRHFSGKQVRPEVVLKAYTEIDELEDYQCEEYMVEKLLTSNRVRTRIPGCICPICQFDVIEDREFRQYLMKEHKIYPDMIKKEIKKKFHSYSQFYRYIWYNR